MKRIFSVGHPTRRLTSGGADRRLTPAERLRRRNAAVRLDRNGGLVFGRRGAPEASTNQAVGERPTFLGFSTQDVKEFLMAYCACFMAVMGLIA